MKEGCGVGLSVVGLGVGLVVGADGCGVGLAVGMRAMSNIVKEPEEDAVSGVAEFTEFTKVFEAVLVESTLRSFCATVIVGALTFATTETDAMSIL